MNYIAEKRAETISAIVPTIGRVSSLERLLRSLAQQTIKPTEIIIADGSNNIEIKEAVMALCWRDLGLHVTWLAVLPPNAVRQREAAIKVSTGELLLLLDDDVELESDCIEELLKPLQADAGVVATMADFNNQTWSTPTRAWRLYLRLVYGMNNGEWQGKVLGPLLRYGFNPVPGSAVAIDWIGSGNSLIRRRAFDYVHGFSKFFLHRATVNEDVDLAIKLSRTGKLMFCPQARIAHYHDPIGRMSAARVAEDDVYNRYKIMRITQQKGTFMATRSILIYIAFENTSNIISFFRTGDLVLSCQRLFGRFSALRKIFFNYSN